MNDDFSADPQTTGFYSLFSGPAFATGFNETADDHDWFRIDSLQTYYDYIIRVDQASPSPKQSGRVGVHDAFGNVLFERSFNSSVPISQRYTHNSLANSDFFVDVFGGFGRYALSIEFDDASDSAAAADELTFNSRTFHASAIETAGDIDFFSYELRAGVEYTFDLLGQDSTDGRPTTLDNPVLSIFSNTGSLLASDSNSGEGRNARIVFTPDTTEQHVFRVFGGGSTTGSYILESDQFDDAAVGIGTDAVLPVDGTLINGQANFQFDVDWYRVELQQGFLYEFESTAGLVLYDSTGERIDAIQPDGNSRRLRYRRRLNEDDSTFFVSAVSSVDYGISGNVVDDFTPGANTGNFAFGPFTETVPGAIETVGDRDRFTGTLETWGQYHFDPIGVGANPLANPAVAIFDENREFVQASGGGRLTFVPQGTFEPGRDYFADVFSLDQTQTGAYRLGFTPGDHAAGDESTAWNVRFSIDGNARIRNALETNDDVDWHRISLTENTWYEFGTRFDATDRFQIRSPSGVTRSFQTDRTSYFQAPEDGDYFLIVDGADRIGGRVSNSFGFDIVEGRNREVENGSLELFSNGSIFAQTNLDRFNIDAVEVYATIPLRYQSDSGGVLQFQPGTYQLLSVNEAATLLPANSVGDEFGEVNLRGQFGASSTPQFTAWGLVETGFTADFSDIAPAPGDLPPFGIEYAFADALPDYLAGDPRFTGFEPLSVSERASVRDALSRWDLPLFSQQFTEVSPGPGNENAATTIFKAALNTDVLAFRTGAGEGGDIVLNTNSPVLADLTPGSEGFFELLRGIGITLGLNETTSRTREESVLGVRTQGFGVYASDPSPIDIRAALPPGTGGPHFSVNPGPSEYVLDNTEFLRTIADAGSQDNVSAAGLANRVNIDLRPGALSFVGRSPLTSNSVFRNSLFTQLDNATGGNFSDGLFGNSMVNEIRGGRGNDLLVGLGGDDFLDGGANNDFYIVGAGHGNDEINENGAGGNDTIRYEGRRNLTALQDDVTFQRIGNDLLISLEWDSSSNSNSDSILIRDMNNAGSRIESLTLLNDGVNVGRISLLSVFTQADGSRGRFQIAPGADSFGRLVAPV